MKRTFIALLLVISFTSCREDDSPSTDNSTNNSTKAYIKFKVDGVQYQYDYGTSFIDNEVEQLGFSFNNGNSATKASIFLTLEKSEPLGLNSYPLVENGTNTIVFTKSNTDKDNNEYFLFQKNYKGNGNVKVTKMKLLAGTTLIYTINGTFDGKLYNKNGGSVLITEGEFFNPLTN